MVRSSISSAKVRYRCCGSGVSFSIIILGLSEFSAQFLQKVSDQDSTHYPLSINPFHPTALKGSPTHSPYVSNLDIMKRLKYQEKHGETNGSMTDNGFVLTSLKLKLRMKY